MAWKEFANSFHFTSRIGDPPQGGRGGGQPAGSYQVVKEPVRNAICKLYTMEGVSQEVIKNKLVGWAVPTNLHAVPTDDEGRPGRKRRRGDKPQRRKDAEERG